MTRTTLPMHFKYDHNLIFLWIFLSFQILVLIIYLKFSYSWNNDEAEGQIIMLKQSIKFLKNHSKELSQNWKMEKYKTYFNSDVNNEIYLKTEAVNNFFSTVNDAVCFQMGTDTEYMKKSKNDTAKNVKCECLPGYHGNDCSLPEVIWRAFIAYRQETVIHKRSNNLRRIIHIFKISHPAEIPLAAIKINELSVVVDLFIVVELNETQYGEPKPFYFKLKLDKGLCKDKQHKILFVSVYKWKEENELNHEIWEKSRKIIKNLRYDDVFIQLHSSVIPSVKALLFFKLYDGYPLPIQFRLKWNVYGYFYQHPNKTKTFLTGCTMQKLSEKLGKDLCDLDRKNDGFIVGDLNHYGGWFCDLCYDSNDILHILQTSSRFEYVLSILSAVIDKRFIEDVIENGLYIDKKTTLIKNYDWNDKYYAPDFVLKHHWNYDFLLTNFYSKLDYT